MARSAFSLFKESLVAKVDLDAAVRRISAFGSFADIVDDMKRTGYVPTIRVDPAFTSNFNKAALAVRQALHRRGLRVWPDFGPYDSRGRHARARAWRKRAY